MRIFQLAQELKIDSQEIMDALHDMGVAAKSNLAVLDEPVLTELRELFKPRPTLTKSVKEEAVQRALAEREARERAVRDAAKREEERKASARQAARQKVALKRTPAERTPAPPAATKDPVPSPGISFPSAPSAALGSEALASAPEPAERSESTAAPAGTSSIAAVAVTEAVGAPTTPAAATSAAATTVSQRPAAAASVPGSRLGKAVIAPPPSTAREKAELLGRPLSQVRGTPAGTRRPSSPGASSPRPAGPRPPTPPRQTRQQQPAAPRAMPAPIPRAEAVPEVPVGEVKISDGITLKDLAERMNRKAKDVIKRLFLEKGIMATINHALDEQTASWVVTAFGGTPTIIGVEAEALTEEFGIPELGASDTFTRRSPVVTLMGHVDHGKTSLLDAIRKTRVAEREAGGITQHIGAYKVTQSREGVPHEIVFLDTPGHEAFTLMRARGAKVTDIVILVVAADDGIMPQTVEAIHHARAAGVPIIVAINKIDKAGANPDRILQQLTEHEILVEQFGGETVAVQVSAKALTGIDHLLEMILLVTELQDLKASVTRPASGTVLEAKLDKTRGPVATVLIQHGNLKNSDVFVVGSTWGRVRAMVDEHDRKVEAAGPSTPVVVMGLEDVPQAGDTLQVFTDEQKARQIAGWRKAKEREAQVDARAKLPTLDTLHEQLKEGSVNELPIVLKTDVQGSAEVLQRALLDLSTSEVKVKIIHAATGAITETDVLLAAASRAIIVGFNVRPERGVQEIIRREGVDTRLHTVIYAVAAEIKQAMLATLSPVQREVYLGRAQVREVFRIAKVGTVAGCYVVDGLIRRDAKARLIRDGVVVWEGQLASLRRFKDDAREVKSGFECGIGLERFNDVKPADEIEAYTIELTRRESLDPAKSNA